MLFFFMGSFWFVPAEAKVNLPGSCRVYECSSGADAPESAVTGGRGSVVCLTHYPDSMLLVEVE